MYIPKLQVQNSSSFDFRTKKLLLKYGEIDVFAIFFSFRIRVSAATDIDGSQVLFTHDRSKISMRMDQVE
jgi:hypothetical protein